MTALSVYFYVTSNKLCSDVPTELQALSSSISAYRVTTSNALGSECPVAGWQSYMVDDRIPDMDGSPSTKSIDGSTGGMIPTELGLMTELTQVDFQSDNMVGPIPTELGQLAKLETYLYLHYVSDNLGQLCANEPLTALVAHHVRYHSCHLCV